MIPYDVSVVANGKSLLLHDRRSEKKLKRRYLAQPRMAGLQGTGFSLEVGGVSMVSTVR